jgi:hypothetical protein
MTDTLRWCLRCEKPSYAEHLCPRCATPTGLLTEQQVKALAPFFGPAASDNVLKHGGAS